MDSNSDSDSSVRSTGIAAFRSSSTIPASPNPMIPSRGNEVYGSEVDSFNSRVNGKVIDNGSALTATAKRVQYGVRITCFYNLLLHHVLRNHFPIGKSTTTQNEI
jgi:hypothetical protein